MNELVEKLARAIWERRTGGNWDARMSWKNASQELIDAKIAKGAHPDNFSDNRDLDDAFSDARTAIEVMRKSIGAVIDPK